LKLLGSTHMLKSWLDNFKHLYTHVLTRFLNHYIIKSMNSFCNIIFSWNIILNPCNTKHYTSIIITWNWIIECTVDTTSTHISKRIQCQTYFGFNVQFCPHSMYEDNIFNIFWMNILYCLYSRNGVLTI